MPFYAFFPRAPVDFWLVPTGYFDESYELNIGWDLFGNPDGYHDESYEYSDLWYGTAAAFDNITFDGYTQYYNQSFEDGYWVPGSSPAAPLPYMRVWQDAQDNATLSLDMSGDLQTWINKGDRPNFEQTTAGNRPVPITVDGYQFIDFIGSPKRMISTRVSPNDFITTVGFHMFVVFNVDAIVTNSGTSYSNEGILTESGGYFNISLRTSTSRIVTANYDGSDDQITQNINLSQTYVLSYYHDSGSIYASLNGGSYSTIASGVTGSITGNLIIGTNYTSGAFFNGKLGEVLVYSAKLPNAQAEYTISYLKNKWGII